MPKLFGTDIPALINKAMGKLLLPVILHSVTQGTRTAGSLTGGANPVETDHTCRGFINDYRDHQIDGTIIRQGDRKVTVLGASIAPAAVPKPNDRVTVEGATYTVVAVKRDPAGATYEMQSR